MPQLPYEKLFLSQKYYLLHDSKNHLKMISNKNILEHPKEKYNAHYIVKTKSKLCMRKEEIKEKSVLKLFRRYVVLRK